MRKADIPSVLKNFFLVALLSISGVLCIATAYDLTHNTGQIIGLCLLFAALGCCLCRFRWGSWPLLALTVLSFWQLWRFGLEDHTEAMLWNISLAAHQAYNTGKVIWWTLSVHMHRDTTAFFMALGIVSALVSSLALSRHATWPAMLMGVLMLAASLLVTDRSPIPFWLLILLGCLLLLGLSVLLRRSRRRIPLRLAVCTALLLASITAIFPPEGYVVPEFPLVDRVVELLQPQDPTRPTDPTSPPKPGDGFYTPDKVDLSRVGTKTFSYRFVFNLTCSETGPQYLREVSYNTYTGTSWLLLKEKSNLGAEQKMWHQETSTVTINTYVPRKNRYTPYYLPELKLTDGKLPNEDDAVVYTYEYHRLVDNWAEIWAQSTMAIPLSQLMWDDSLQLYLDLPESTREGAQKHLDNIGLDSSQTVLESAQAIEQYVKASARYSLRTGRMPGTEADFALWFLEQSETGYCIHFATAATVLLRSAGIPARYVTGFLVKTGAGLDRAVYHGNAHAWVEYWLPGLGWAVLDPTPSASDPEPTDPSGPVPSTAPGTQPSDPSVPQPSIMPATRPTPPTQPAPQPTAPSGGQEATIPGWLIPLLQWLGWIALAAVVLALQWQLRLALLQRRLCHGSPNAQALKRWKYCLRLSRLRRQKPPEKLLHLANKARFSQHTLTSQELRQFDRYRAETVAQLRLRNPLWQFVYRIVLALY